MQNTLAQQIAVKNDTYRRTLSGCKIMITASLRNSPALGDILQLVKNFNTFGPENDPHGERDMAFFEWKGEKYFFKFDYYDANYQYFEEDGERVLTIGNASDY